ncbi:hypothetical protein [Roseivivax sediminis]|uniref:Uncharacterized protein n=1 Tax=Roseivivax sediminis TaxID=936889 RepID=A0A1I1S8S9_9RHOB|nr:hypothetical protein [Roseivivax sediminis]SFD42905.1 hypothetical protein SAMN04515678_10136 [Roseivivax sediminis]
MIEMDEDYTRVPGLYGAWDVGMLLEAGRRYRIEDGGRTDDGQALFMVFRRQESGAVR